MQRSQELAMSQLENHPGGFQHLRRMYTDVMEPMNNATMGEEAPSTPSAPVSQSGALPNPWSSPSTSPQQTTSTPSSSTGMPAGMGGLFGPGAGMPGAGGMPGMGGMGGPQHAAAMNALQNPAMRQMMSQMLSDPNTIQQVRH